MMNDITLLCQCFIEFKFLCFRHFVYYTINKTVIFQRSAIYTLYMYNNVTDNIMNINI